ncbi:helix-turn-helix domain-containing protein [Lysobacter sp. HDW10]|uniref:helix-turn-helix domain-containing protein n=1 Tax=Lysobacter sp. HDW10 TaxID=2714936 RepID=UPI00197C107E|nr:helix-turn-helix domain-containing protein [Lysobacter sp. HDW10]
MEHEMKISSSVVRRLRTARGWSQDQLAVASGLSLRTIQRVEAEGIASMDTAVSLAATFEIRLIELQEDQHASTNEKPALGHSALFFGTAVITVAALSESGRLPSPQSDAFTAINVLAAIVGAALLVPSLVRAFKDRQYIGAALALIGTFLITLLAGGGIYALIGQRPLTWQLAGFGVSGAVLVFIAIRELRSANSPARV